MISRTLATSLESHMIDGLIIKISNTKKKLAIVSNLMNKSV